jgi:hypothetical protein
VALCTLASALGGVGCGSGGSTRDPAAGGAGAGTPGEVVLEAPAEVRSNVHVLPDEIMAQASVDGDTIVLPGDVGPVVMGLRPGDVIVSTFGRGFIRVVQTTEAGSGVAPQGLRPLGMGAGAGWLRLVTTVGSFLDVFADLNVTLQRELEGLSVDVSGERLAGDDDAHLTLTRAEMSLAPSIMFRMRIADGAVQSMALELRDTLQVTEAVKALAKVKASWSNSKKLWTSPDLRVRFVLGGIPIISIIHFDLEVDASAETSGLVSLEAGATCTNSIGSRVAYELGRGIHADPIEERSCAPIWETELQANASAGLGLTLGAYWDFFAIGGVSVSFRGGAQASAELCPPPGEWSIELTGKARASATFEPFGVALGSVSRTLFDDVEPLASGRLDALSEICATGTDGSGGAGGMPNDVQGGNGGDNAKGALGRPGESRKDPHLLTFDGLLYDMQAAGEFLLAGSADAPEGDVIQTRQEPLAVHLCPHVTLNTAVAARIGNAHLRIYAGDPAKVLVDDDAVSLGVTESLELGPGATLTRTARNVWEARWADARLEVRVDAYANQNHLDVAVWPPVAWKGKARGLLGDNDGVPDNDLRLPDGTRLRASMTWEELYLDYAEPLRVGAADSLFDYEVGQSPATFRSTALPGKPSVPQTLPSTVREAAAAVCDATGVTDPALLDACTMDVACSGGDASQADWIKDVEPPAGSRVLSAGPLRVELETTFAATSGAYADTDDLDAACRAEFGADALLADWSDVKGIPVASLSNWLVDVGLTSYDADELYLASGGQRLWQAPRHFFIAWHDHKPVSGFLTHDTIDDHLIDLGSWYGWKRRVLCRVCDGEPCGTALGSQPTHPAASCSDIVQGAGDRGDGGYWIQPPGSSAPFEVDCDMTINGGGWTRLTQAVAQSLDSTSLKRYLYTTGGVFYISPPTKLAWVWNVGQELTGTYAYFDGSTSGKLMCSGSTEKPPFGIGCSTGPGPMLKVLPWDTNDAAGGTCTVCQDIPFVFKQVACASNISIFVRFEP